NRLTFGLKGLDALLAADTSGICVGALDGLIKRRRDPASQGYGGLDLRSQLFGKRRIDTLQQIAQARSLDLAPVLGGISTQINVLDSNRIVDDVVDRVVAE